MYTRTCARGSLTYDAQCLRLASQVSEYVRAHIDWPEPYFERVRVRDGALPRRARRLQEGWLEEEGAYGFVIRVMVGNGRVDFRWRIFCEEERWFLGYWKSDAPLRASLEDDAELAVLGDHVHEVLKETIARQVWR